MKRIFLLLFCLPFCTMAQTPSELWSKATKANNAQDYKKALSYVNQYINKGKKEANAYFFRANIKLSLKDYEAALNDYSSSIAKDPTVAAVYYNRGICYENLQKPNAAIQSYASAIRADKKYINAYINQGRLYRNQRNREEALNCYTKALEINPDHEQLLVNRAGLYQDMIKHKEAMKDLQRLCKINDKKAEYFYRLAKMKHQVSYELFQTAKPDLDKAIALNPQYTDAFIERATWFMGQEQYHKAIKDLNKAKSIDPNAEVKHLIEAAEFELEMLEEE